MVSCTHRIAGHLTRSAEEVAAALEQVAQAGEHCIGEAAVEDMAGGQEAASKRHLVQAGGEPRAGGNVRNT